MGRSTVAELIARGQNWNSYNNTGIDSTAKWVDAFNSALKDLVEDIGLTASYALPYAVGTSEYDLPDDYFEVLQVTDSSNYPITKRNYLNMPFFQWDSYYIFDAGSAYKFNFADRNTTETINVLYTRYSARLATDLTLQQKPEVPTVGEDALIYYAISKSLRNNNQIGQAVEVEQQYEKERKKIRDAKYRAAAGW